MPVIVTAFYKFVTIADLEDLRQKLLALGAEHGIMGTILIVTEGINSTVAGSDAGIHALLSWLRADPRFSDLGSKESYADEMPFRRFKVRIRQEIATLPQAGGQSCQARRPLRQAGAMERVDRRP